MLDRGVPGCPRRLPGTDKLLPKTSWAADMSRSGWTATLLPRRTQGRADIHLSPCSFPMSTREAFREFLIVWCLFINSSVGRCMIGWGEMNFHIECLHYVLVQVTDKGIAVVRHRHMWNPEPGRPLEKGFGTFL